MTNEVIARSGATKRSRCRPFHSPARPLLVGRRPAEARATMTLRLRLFALLVALAALLAVGEWVLVRALSAELEEELAAAAASVSEDVLRLLRFDVPPPSELA